MCQSISSCCSSAAVKNDINHTPSNGMRGQTGNVIVLELQLLYITSFICSTTSSVIAAIAREWAEVFCWAVCNNVVSFSWVMTANLKLNLNELRLFLLVWITPVLLALHVSQAWYSYCSADFRITPLTVFKLCFKWCDSHLLHQVHSPFI